MRLLTFDELKRQEGIPYAGYKALAEEGEVGSPSAGAMSERPKRTRARGHRQPPEISRPTARHFDQPFPGRTLLATSASAVRAAFLPKV